MERQTLGDGWDSNFKSRTNLPYSFFLSCRLFTI